MDLPKKSLSDRLSPSFIALLAASDITSPITGDAIEYARQLPAYVQCCSRGVPEFVEIDCLGPVEAFSISCHRISSFHAFSTLRELYLYNHTGEIDLERLKDIFVIRFENCHNLADLTPLEGGNLRQLGLWGCDQIVDLSPLSGLDSISIEYCQGVVDVSPLKDVRKVRLEFCDGIEGVSCLEGGKIKELHIEGCIGITDVVSLINTVDRLILYCCSEEIQQDSLQGGKATVTFLD